MRILINKESETLSDYVVKICSQSKKIKESELCDRETPPETYIVGVLVDFASPVGV